MNIDDKVNAVKEIHRQLATLKDLLERAKNTNIGIDIKYGYNNLSIYDNDILNAVIPILKLATKSKIQFLEIQLKELIK